MTTLAVTLAWLSYAGLYFARADRGPRRRGARIAAAALFAGSVWAFDDLESGFGAVVLATLAWTLAASLLPLVHRASPRVSRASIVLAIAISIGATLAS